MTRDESPSINQEGETNVIGAVSSGQGSTAINKGDISVGRTPAGGPHQQAGQDAAEAPEASQPSRTRELPPYRAVLVVDARGFSESVSAQQPELSESIVRVLDSAFTRSGLAGAWADRRFRARAHTGDGYIVGLRPEVLPLLLHPFLRELQDELWEWNRRRLSAQPRLRLRASIHVGPLADEGRSSDGVGKPMTDTHRLLDSAAVRGALRDTHPDVTFLAAIVSRRVFEDVVEGGYTDLHPAQFTPVAAESKGGFAELAYLHVPRPAGQPGGG